MKKNDCIFRDNYPGIRKLLNVMKLTVFLLLISVFSVFAGKTYSQTKVLNLNMNNSTVKEVLQNIEEQSEFYFMYSEKLVDVNRKVSVNVNDQKVNEVLDEVFAETNVIYKVKDRFILLTTPEVGDADFTFQQQNSVSGTVTDEAGQPLPGVTVVVKGTTRGVVTDADGNYSVTNIPENATLEFSFVGMRKQEVVVGTQTKIDVTLENDVIGLEEVVTIGYGTARKQDLTGSIANVKADEFIKYQPASVTELLRSAVAGLKVGYSTRASATPLMEIRGDNTIKADATAEAVGNQPLYVVDGVIFSGSLSEINVNDIESVDVLKDASAAAIYGSRASNGVVVFTTKKGSSTKPTFRFSAKYGIVTAANRIETYTGNEALDWYVDVYESINSKLTDPWSKWDAYDNVPDQYKADWLAANNIPGETDKTKIDNVWLDNLGFEQSEKDYYFAGNSFDWEDWLFQTGQRQDYNLSVSGRGNKVTYYWSLGYRNNESVVVGDSFSAISSRLNLDISVTDFLNIGLNTNFSYQDEGQQPLNYGLYRSLSPFDTPWESGMPQTKENLKLYSVGNNLENPLMDYSYITRKYDGYKLFPTMYAKINFPLGIVFTSNFTQRLDFTRRYQFNDVANPRWESGSYREGASRENIQIYEWQWDNILNWNKTFGKHQFDVTALANAERNQYWQTYAFANNFSPTAALGYHNLSNGLNQTNSSNDEVVSRTALLGRVNYTFNNRYYLSASIRRDGFSRFGENNKFATFPSVSAGWTISQEEFMASADWVSFLKLRASWGINGNSSGLQPYQSYARLQTGKLLNYNSGYNAVQSLYINRLGNTDLAWEKNQAWNIGLDYGFWNGRLKGAIDIYTSKTNDLLLDKVLPTVTGFPSITTNVGQLQNKGFDLAINTINIEKSDFRWTSSLNVNYNKNKIVSLTGVETQVIDSKGNPVFDNSGNPVMEEADDLANGWFIGEDKDVIWDYQIDGVYQIGEETEAAIFKLYPGDFKVGDVLPDSVINVNDKVFQGTTSAPWYLTFRNEFAYKGFDMGLVFLAKLGYKGGTTYPFNNDADIYRTHNWFKLPYWMPDNPINDHARINSIQLAAMNVWVPKSYVRFQNFSLGYNLPENLIESMNLGSAHVAFNIENVAVFTKWEIGDPESDTEMPRVYSFSVDFSF